MRKKTIEIIWALMLITMLCCMQGCAFIHSEKNHIYFNNAEPRTKIADAMFGQVRVVQKNERYRRLGWHFFMVTAHFLLDAARVE